MPSALAPAVWALCCLLASAASGDDGRDQDAAALVQSAIRVHRDGGEEQEQDLPSVPKRATPQQRAAARAAARAKVHSQLNPRGTGAAIDGTASVSLHRGRDPCNEGCSLTWGDQVGFAFNVNLPDGLEPEDKMTTHWVLKIKPLSEQNPLSTAIISENVFIDQVCDICDGQCKFDVDWGHILTVKITQPTEVFDPSYCDAQGKLKPGVKQATLFSDRVIQIPSGLGATLEELSADVSYELYILRKDGKRRAATFKHALLGPRTAAPPASLAQVSAVTAQAIAGAVRQVRQPMGPIALTQAYLKALAALVQAAAEELPKGQLNLQRETEAPTPYFLHAMKINGMENANPRNYSWTATPCHQTDRLGSYRCLFPFGSEFKSELSMHMESVLEAGSFMVLALEPPKVDGLMGMVVKRMWKQLTQTVQTEYVIPECGPAFDATLGESKVHIAETKCGYRAMDVLQPLHSFQTFTRESFKNLYLPGNVKFPDILLSIPMTVTSRMTILHSDGRKVFDVEYETGFVRGSASEE